MTSRSHASLRPYYTMAPDVEPVTWITQLIIPGYLRPSSHNLLTTTDRDFLCPSPQYKTSNQGIWYHFMRIPEEPIENPSRGTRCGRRISSVNDSYTIEFSIKERQCLLFSILQVPGKNSIFRVQGWWLQRPALPPIRGAGDGDTPWKT